MLTARQRKDMEEIFEIFNGKKVQAEYLLDEDFSAMNPIDDFDGYVDEDEIGMGSFYYCSSLKMDRIKSVDVRIIGTHSNYIDICLVNGVHINLSN
jgi:hypothetical protein